MTEADCLNYCYARGFDWGGAIQDLPAGILLVLPAAADLGTAQAAHLLPGFVAKAAVHGRPYLAAFPPRLHREAAGRTVRTGRRNVPPGACPIRDGPFLLPCTTGWQRKRPSLLEPPEFNPLVGLAAAAAARLVGIGRAGHAVGGRGWLGWYLDCRQRFSGATVPGLFHIPNATLSAAWHRALCGRCHRHRIRPQKHPPRRGAWLRSLGQCLCLE